MGALIFSADFPLDSGPVAPQMSVGLAHDSDELVELAFNRAKFVLFIP